MTKDMMDGFSPTQSGDQRTSRWQRVEELSESRASGQPQRGAALTALGQNAVFSPAVSFHQKLPRGCSSYRNACSLEESVICKLSLSGEAVCSRAGLWLRLLCSDFSKGVPCST
ncbi:unnamed protein product [Caretta caretta]